MLVYVHSCDCFVILVFMKWCSYVLFFFFKQKTAYEMRISDWSSDVCSSDLGVTTWSGVARGGWHFQTVSYRLNHFRPEKVHLDGLHDAEIGRASCRERVCQYV